MTQLTTINRICEHLEKYVYDKIWNDPYSEYRTFFKPISLNTVAATGIFFGRYSKVQLPSKVDYKSGSRIFFYLYAIPAGVFRTLRLNVTTWNRLDTFCNENLIDLEFFSGAGRRCIRNAIFLKQSDMNDCILIAIERTAFLGCFGTSATPSDEFYFGKYLDSDLNHSVYYECKRLTSKEIPAYQKTGTPEDPITKTGTPTYTLYNGRLLTGEYKDYQKLLSTGAFVENAYDENIIGTFDVDCCNQSWEYTNEEFKKRILVHIPKELNPDHNVITPNTCDMYLVPTEMPTETGYPQLSAVYLYQCGRAEHFHQLTHNDLSIDLDWLQEIATKHGFTKYFIRVMVRDQGKPKKAIRDANYMNILYIHDDEDIIKFLLDISEYNMPFWTAKHLESDGAYGRALLRRRDTKPRAADQCALCMLSGNCDHEPLTDQQCPTFSRRSFNDYIDIIGYYHTLALVGKRVTHFEVVDDRLGTKYMKTEDTIALKGKSYYANNLTTGKFEKLDLKVDDPIPTDRRVYELVGSAGPAVNEFIVRAPLALVDLLPIDFKAVAYLNGIRIDDENIEILTGVDTDNQHHREIEFTPDATWWTKVIDVNYAHRLRVIIKNTEFAVGDRVCIEIFDNRHDGRTEVIDVPELKCKVTDDTEFVEGTRYYVKHDEKFVRAKIDSLMIGQPIDGTTMYDVGVRKIVYTQTVSESRIKGRPYYLEDSSYIEGYRTADDKKGDYNADGSFRTDLVYYDRDASEVIKFSKFYELEDETLTDITVQMVTEDEWKIYRVNDEQDVPYEKTHDTTFLEDRTYYVLQEPNVFLMVKNKDELIGKPIDGTSYTVTLPDGSTMSASVFYELVDYYKVNNVSYYRVRDPGDFDTETKKLLIREDLAGYRLLLVEGPLFFEDGGEREVNYTSTGYLGDELWKRPDLTHDNFPLDSEIVFLNNHRLVRGLDYTTEGYIPGDFCNGAKLYLQNVSYLQHDTTFQMLRTCQSTLSNQRGYIKGDIIQWAHSNPFWFDELCIMTVNGEVCSNLKHDLGTLTLLDNHYENGTPFEFRMSVSTKIKNLIGDYGESVDRERIALIKAYFDSRFRRPDFLTIVKKAHKIYSLYMEQIITAYVRDPDFTFVRKPAVISFEEQFKMFTDWKRRDVAYNLSAEDFKYVDVYPMFNRLQMDDRYQFDQIGYMVKQLRPTDKYQHKDASNVK